MLAKLLVKILSMLWIPPLLIGHPLGYDVAAAPGYKPVDHIEAALHRLQVGVPPAAPHDALGPLLVT